jgi:hypothetical protein
MNAAVHAHAAERIVDMRISLDFAEEKCSLLHRCCTRLMRVSVR